MCNYGLVKRNKIYAIKFIEVTQGSKGNSAFYGITVCMLLLFQAHASSDDNKKINRPIPPKEISTLCIVITKL